MLHAAAAVASEERAAAVRDQQQPRSQSMGDLRRLTLQDYALPPLACSVRRAAAAAAAAAAVSGAHTVIPQPNG
jgi:hypothetical protein